MKPLFDREAIPKTPATLLCDFYKISHRPQYPEGTEYVYATWTPRGNKHYPSVDSVIAFGIQRFNIRYLIQYFNENFFSRPLEDVLAEYTRVIKNCLLVEEPETQHIEDLHALGYIPLEIKAVDEGTRVPFRVPMLTIVNTDSRFFWLGNYFETLMSAELWPGMTVATIADRYKRILDKYAMVTVGNTDFTMFQGHDFSMRGIEGLEASKLMNTGHLVAGFAGTDTIPAILDLEDYYAANIEKELVGCSVNATEHSVMCAGGSEDEFNTYKRLMTEVHPEGILSIVSDTWDLWTCIDTIIRGLKPEIMAREGKVVIRPDSGDPADIICGNIDIECISFDDASDIEEAKEWMREKLVDEVREATPHGEMGRDEVSGYFLYDDQVYEIEIGIEWNRHDKQYYFEDGSRIQRCEPYTETPANKGVIQCLWEIFGGTKTDEGFNLLDEHIGAIYGDSITPEICKDVCKRLMDKGFASINVVFGIGSYTYQYKTRDTFGFAMKSTSVTINGTESHIFKDPITDDGMKKSNKGRIAVLPGTDTQKITCIDGLFSGDILTKDLLKTVFVDGHVPNFQTLAEVREKIQSS